MHFDEGDRGVIKRIVSSSLCLSSKKKRPFAETKNLLLVLSSQWNVLFAKSDQLESYKMQFANDVGGSSYNVIIIERERLVGVHTAGWDGGRRRAPNALQNWLIIL